MCKYPEREQVRLPLRVSKERKKKEIWEKKMFRVLALWLLWCEEVW